MTNSHNDTPCQLFHAEKPSNALECESAEARGTQLALAQTGNERSRRSGSVLCTGDAGHGLLYNSSCYYIEVHAQVYCLQTVSFRICIVNNGPIHRIVDLVLDCRLGLIGQMTPHNASMCDSSGHI
jgi:hypothetical protein